MTKFSMPLRGVLSGPRATHVASAEKALRAHRNTVPAEWQRGEDLAELLLSLMHWAGELRVDFNLALHRARQLRNEERRT